MKSERILKEKRKRVGVEPIAVREYSNNAFISSVPIQHQGKPY